MVFVVFEGNNHFIWRPLIGWASTIAPNLKLIRVLFDSGQIGQAKWRI